MNDWIKSTIENVLNPTFEDYVAEPLIFKYGDISIEGYTGNINEKVIEVGMSPINVVTITSNNLLFDPDKTCILTFEYSDVAGDIIIDDTSITVTGGIDVFQETALDLLDDKYSVIKNGTKVSILKIQSISGTDQNDSMYVEGSAIGDLGIEEGYYEPQRARFYINGLLHYIRENTVKYGYAGTYLKFQLVRK